MPYRKNPTTDRREMENDSSLASIFRKKTLRGAEKAHPPREREDAHTVSPRT